MKCLGFPYYLCLFLLQFPASLIAQEGLVHSDQEVFEAAAKNIELYRQGNVQIKVLTSEGKAARGVKISLDQSSHDFMFGALLFDLTGDKMDVARQDLFKERFLELFNYGIVPFYWGGFEYLPGHPRWDRIDKALAWCMENDITVKGHPLAWTHEAGTPDYILNMSLEDSETMLASRILENVLGFEDITYWDVVNEPVNTVTWAMAHADKDKQHRYDSDVPLNDIANWVEKAYKTADRANPDNYLILNEFKQFADQDIRMRFYTFVEELLNRDTPIDGLGIQAHEPREDWFSPVDVWNTLNLYSDFNLPIHITEFAPQSKGAEITGGYKSGSWDEASQAEFTEMMYRIWFGHPSVKSINWWGFSDSNAWLPGCGITNENLDPKPVYHTLKNLIREEWMTRGVHLNTDKRGEAGFRGFYGEYSVDVLSRDGKTISRTFHLTEGEANEWLIELD